MDLVIDARGTIRCLYDEAIDLSALGSPSIRRASHVEPDAAGRWWADLTPIGGPTLGPLGRRSDALDAERAWLDQHWLNRPRPVHQTNTLSFHSLSPGKGVDTDQPSRAVESDGPEA
jgi:hypothetical protein